MAVVKELEWTLFLHVGEMVVPLKLRDQRDPERAKGKKRKDAERRHDLRAAPGTGLQIGDRGLIRHHAGWRHKSEAQNFYPDLWRHYPRQIAGVGKKEKDLLERDGHPLLKLKAITHFG